MRVMEDLVSHLFSFFLCTQQNQTMYPVCMRIMCIRVSAATQFWELRTCFQSEAWLYESSCKRSASYNDGKIWRKSFLSAMLVGRRRAKMNKLNFLARTLMYMWATASANSLHVCVCMWSQLELQMPVNKWQNSRVSINF